MKAKKQVFLGDPEIPTDLISLQGDHEAPEQEAETEMPDAKDSYTFRCGIPVSGKQQGTGKNGEEGTGGKENTKFPVKIQTKLKPRRLTVPTI